MSRHANRCSTLILPLVGFPLIALLFGSLPEQVFGQEQPIGAGIKIDADGIVSIVRSAKNSERLNKKRLAALAAHAETNLAADLNQSSDLRKVSLVRLEMIHGECVDSGKAVPDDIKYLAGLQQIDYVFVDPDSKDLILAGPAEGFAPNALGRMVGVTTGRPVLQLDDLLVALRTLQRENRLGCSIDPVPERLSALRQHLARNSRPGRTAAVKARFKKFARILGLQEVSIWGVPADSHYAQTLVEADYQMKRIAQGHLKTRIRGFKSHLSLLTARDSNNMQRYWFVPKYDAILKSEDGNAFQLTGQRVQLLAEDEVVSASGKRRAAAKTSKSTTRFVQQFTEHLPEIAENLPVFAELQNLIDLAVVAALIREEGLAEKVGWTMSHFLDPERAQVTKGNVPRAVPTLANARKVSGRTVTGLVGGGVVINPVQTLNDAGKQSDGSDRLESFSHAAIKQPRPEEHPWWWD